MLEFVRAEDLRNSWIAVLLAGAATEDSSEFVDKCFSIRTKNINFNNRADTWKSILTLAAGGNTSPVEVHRVFQQNKTRVIARAVLQNRMDIVKRLSKYHMLDEERRQGSLSAGPRDWNPVCSAVRWCDFDVVSFLTEQGYNVNKFDTICGYSVRLSFFLCALRYLCHTSTDHFADDLDVDSALDNLKNIVTNFVDVETLSNICEHSDLQPSNMSVIHIVLQGLNSTFHFKQSSVPVTRFVTCVRFKLELLKHFVGLGLRLKSDGEPGSKTSISDFIVRDDLTRAGAFHLFQAGADPGFIRRKPAVARVKAAVRTYVPTVRNESAYIPINTDLCKVLVLEGHDVSSSKVIKDFRSLNIKEFLDWYEHVKAKPFSLQCQSRTLIRRILVRANDHRSIMPRIEALNLPERLKEYLRHEGARTEVDLTVSFVHD